MSTTPDYTATLERFMASEDFEEYLRRAELAGANGQPSWVELHEDGSWIFMAKEDAAYRVEKIPLLIYWSVKPADPKKKLRDDLQMWLSKL